MRGYLYNRLLQSLIRVFHSRIPLSWFMSRKGKENLVNLRWEFIKENTLSTKKAIKKKRKKEREKKKTRSRPRKKEKR